MCPFICCQVHVFEKYPNTPPPGMIHFSTIFITSPKTFNVSLGVAGKEILTLSALYQSFQFLPLSDRTSMRCDKSTDAYDKCTGLMHACVMISQLMLTISVLG